MLYRGMDRAQLDAAYNNLAAVPSFPKLFADWAARSARFRERHLGHLGLAYGDRPRERLDLFLAGNPAAPTLAYIHGGYWQMTQQTRWTNPPHPTLSPHKGWAEREARRLT
jgi:acetyl esterase/lipase